MAPTSAAFSHRWLQGQDATYTEHIPDGAVKLKSGVCNYRHSLQTVIYSEARNAVPG